MGGKNSTKRTCGRKNMSPYCSSGFIQVSGRMSSKYTLVQVMTVDILATMPVNGYTEIHLHWLENDPRVVKVSLLSEPFLYICIAPIHHGDVMCLQLLEIYPWHKTHKSCARWAPPAPLFPLWQQRVSAECTDVGGVLQGTLFFTHLLWRVALITCTKKKRGEKKNPISGTFWAAPYSRPLRFSVPKLQGVTNMLFRLNEFAINKGQFSPLFTFGLDWHFYCPCSSYTQP